MPRVLNSNPNEPRYIHLRYQNDDGSIANQGGVTIAWRDSDEHEDKVEVAFSRCIWYDNFNKKIGRAIALGNLKYFALYLVDKVGTPSEQYEKIIDFVNKKIDEHEQISTAVKESAKATIQ